MDVGQGEARFDLGIVFELGGVGFYEHELLEAVALGGDVVLGLVAEFFYAGGDV